MDSELFDINQENVREAFIDSTINLTYANPLEIVTLLRIAVTKDDTKYATAILDLVPDILQHDQGGGKILWHAMENGNEILARKLIFAGADLNYRSRNGTNILHTFMVEREALVSFMIERGADTNITDASGRTILYKAVKEKLTTIVETFSRLDIKYSDEARILKEAASSYYSTDLLPALVRSSDVAIKKARSRMALSMYLEIRANNEIDFDLVRILVDAALPPQHTNSEVVEILKTVVKFRDRIEVVKLLLYYVSELDGESQDVAELLCSACGHSNSLMSMLLINKGADINCHAKDYKYPLHEACRKKSLQNLHLLLSLDADLTVRDDRGRTPFAYMPIEYREQHKLVIRHLAIRVSKNMNVDPNDIAKIEEHPNMKRYYEVCINELWKMKRTKIWGDISFFCFFEKSLEELCSLARHVNFLKTYYLHQKENSVSFPRFSMQIHHTFKIAVDRKNILMARAKQYEDATMSYPPYGRIRHLAYDTSELENFERKYYFSLYEKINDPEDRSMDVKLLY